MREDLKDAKVVEVLADAGPPRPSRSSPPWLGLLFLVAVSPSACVRADADAREATHVDSVVAWDVALARFRDGLTEPPRLAGGADRREALVQSFVAAVERRDSLALRKLMITRAEFAYHYYPTAPEAHAPYDLTPALLWFMLEQGSLKGIRRVQQDLGGTPLGYAGHRCDAPPSHQGDNRVWGPCVILRVHSAGDTVAQRLFGSILERNGRFKFISYSNDR